MTISGYTLTLAMIAFGIIICFFGFKLFKLSVTVAGVIVGYWTGSFVIDFLGDHMGLDPESIARLVVPIIFAILFGVLAFSFYEKAFIVVVAALVTRLLFTTTQKTDFIPVSEFKVRLVVFAVCLVVGVIIGVACYLMQKTAIIFLSAVGGATLIKVALVPYILRLTSFCSLIAQLLTKIFATDIKPYGAIGGILILSFSIAGLIVQIRREQ